MIFLKRLSYITVALFAVLAFVSCDDDFNTIGGELIGGQLDSLPRYDAKVVAYSKNINGVQTNNLPSSLLGVYIDPVYGKQIANVLTQLSLSTNNPLFGTEPSLDSVVLTLPYFNTQTELNDLGNPVYKLDSVYGNMPFKLKISRSNFFLNDFNPESNFEVRQKYYSDQGPLFKSNLVGDPLYVNEALKPSAQEVVYLEENINGEMDTIRAKPRLRVNLATPFFQQNIIDKQGSIELSNNNNFRNFIRGLYFEAEALNGNGSMALLNFTDPEAGITLYYTNLVVDTADSDEDGDVTEMVEKQNSYKLNFGSNTVNTFSQAHPSEILAEMASVDPEIGAENLFLKGGEGSMVIIELFKDEAELEELKANKWLINEANLTFYVNQDKIQGGATEPERIYLYNLDTNQPLIDYSFDQTFNQAAPLNSVSSHSGRLVRNEDKNGISYKLRITEHVNRILNKDSTNVRLGLVVSQNINLIGNSALRTPLEGINRIPAASVISPEGTVLYGNMASDVAKRLKLNIFYTETNN
ncbi:MAG TPA: DUF4270 domain-containing protein [Gillisia sp.]|nr:DUF4270 domain-containing protein [Gillisia sp.]